MVDVDNTYVWLLIVESWVFWVVFVTEPWLVDLLLGVVVVMLIMVDWLEVENVSDDTNKVLVGWVFWIEVEVVATFIDELIEGENSEPDLEVSFTTVE